MGPTPLHAALSAVVGWLADRRLPRLLRRPIFGAYARLFDVNVDEARLAVDAYPSLGAFFVRGLREGARPLDAGDGWLSPVDARVQASQAIAQGETLQAKGKSYAVSVLLDSEADARALEGGHALTLYLSPRDYHRIHAPRAARLEEVRWLAGAKRSVAPKVLLKRMVFPTNERVVLRLDSESGPFWMVLVGALNVSRIRVVGVPPGGAVAESGRAFERGEELARFEMGSTVILLWPPGGAQPLELEDHAAVRMGTTIAGRGARA